MRVRIAYTIEAGDDYRRAIAHRAGRHGELATREEIVAWNEEHGAELDSDILDELSGCWMGCDGGDGEPV